MPREPCSAGSRSRATARCTSKAHLSPTLLSFKWLEVIRNSGRLRADVQSGFEVRSGRLHDRDVRSKRGQVQQDTTWPCTARDQGRGCRRPNARKPAVNYLERRLLSADVWMRKSSSFFPDWSCAVSQRGCFPRPAQVSVGFSGFLYFGNTCGYGRRAWVDFCALTPGSSWRSRRSSRDFSAAILRPNSNASVLRRAQSWSTDIRLRSRCFIILARLI